MGGVCFVTGGWDRRTVSAPPSCRFDDRRGNKESPSTAGSSRSTRKATSSGSPREPAERRAGSLGVWAVRIARLCRTRRARSGGRHGVYDAATGKPLSRNAAHPRRRRSVSQRRRDLSAIGRHRPGRRSRRSSPGTTPTSWRRTPAADRIHLPRLSRSRADLEQAGRTARTAARRAAALATGLRLPGGFGTYARTASPRWRISPATACRWHQARGQAPQIVVATHRFSSASMTDGGILLNRFTPGEPELRMRRTWACTTIAGLRRRRLPEVGICGRATWSEARKGFIWQSQTFDCSSATGSSVFDFEGKGTRASSTVTSAFPRLRRQDGRDASAGEETRAARHTKRPSLRISTERRPSAGPQHNVCQYSATGQGAG